MDLPIQTLQNKEDQKMMKPKMMLKTIQHKIHFQKLFIQFSPTIQNK